MNHRLALPARFNRTSPAPLVVALHGCTQNAADFAAGTRLDRFAERYGAIVLYPEQSERANPRRCWNWFLPENQRRDGDEPGQILALVGSVMERYAIDRTRVAVVGLSAGAAMAAILAEQAPDVFTAAGLVAGVALHAAHDLRSAYAAMRGDGLGPSLPPVVTPLRSRYDRLRVSIWTGLRDEVVATENAFRLARQFGALVGVRETSAQTQTLDDGTRTRWFDARGRDRIELRTVDRLGHAWSGGSWRGSHTAPMTANATEGLLEFFFGSPGAAEQLAFKQNR